MVGKRGEDEEEVSNKKMMCSGGVDLFDVIPEGCIAAAISLTGPRDACRLSAVSKIFKSAADSDAVWTRFLPRDYHLILARSNAAKPLHSLSTKDLFFHLANHPLLIDNSTKCFFLDKTTGKKCFTISARDLAITWGDTPRYWAFHPSPDSRFPQVAELHSVCWLEIRGKIKSSMLSPNTTYIAYFVFKMTDAVYGFYSPIEMSVTTQATKSESRKVHLQDEEDRNRSYQIIPRRMTLFNRIRTPFFHLPPTPIRQGHKFAPKQRMDGWLEVAMGEVTTHLAQDAQIHMSVLEVDAGNWKGGLIVEGIELRPKLVSE